MRRVGDNRNPVRDKFGQGKHGFGPGNPQTGQPATTPGYELFDSWQEEMASVVEGAGFTLKPDQNNQLLLAIRAISWGNTASRPTTLAGYGITDGAPQAAVDALLNGAATAKFSYYLREARKIAMTGDGNWSVKFDATDDATATLTLSNTGVAAGSYSIVTVDTKGRVTAGIKPSTLAGYGITDAAPQAAVDALLNGAATAKFSYYLREARKIAMTGDGSWSVKFDATDDATATLTLSNTGVAAGSYGIVTVDAKGRVTAGIKPSTLAGYGITDAVSRQDFTGRNIGLGPSGYRMLPGGDLEQWGIAIIDSDNVATVPFWFDFRECSGVWVQQTTGIAGVGTVTSGWAVTAMTKSGFNLLNDQGRQAFYWRAIGSY